MLSRSWYLQCCRNMFRFTWHLYRGSRRTFAVNFCVQGLFWSPQVSGVIGSRWLHPEQCWSRPSHPFPLEWFLLSGWHLSSQSLSVYIIRFSLHWLLVLDMEINSSWNARKATGKFDCWRAWSMAVALEQSWADGKKSSWSSEINPPAFLPSV